MFIKSHEAETQYRRQCFETSVLMDIAAALNGSYINADSLRNESDRLLAVEERLKSMERTHENTLSDLRQETNNIINKVNGWLGFWIAILAIFCGIMPIVIQYVLQRKAKNEFERMVSSLDDKAHSHHLFNIVTSLHINRECSVIRNSSKQKDFIDLIVSDAYLSLNHLLEKTDEDLYDVYDTKREMILISAIMQYCRLIDFLKELSDCRKIRELNILKDQLRALINDILDHENISRENIRARLTDLLPKLCSLHAYA